MSNFRISLYWELNPYFPSFFVLSLLLFSLLSFIFPYFLSKFLPKLQLSTLFSLFLQSLLHHLFQIVFLSLFFILLIYCYMSNILLAFISFSLFLSFGSTVAQLVMASSFKRFLYHTQRRTTASRTPLDG